MMMMMMMNKTHTLQSYLQDKSRSQYNLRTTSQNKELIAKTTELELAAILISFIFRIFVSLFYDLVYFSEDLFLTLCYIVMSCACQRYNKRKRDGDDGGGGGDGDDRSGVASPLVDG